MKNPIVTLVNWLERHKKLNLALVFLYGVVLILLHDDAVQLSIALMNSFGLAEYNLAVKWFSLGFGLVIAGVFAWGLLKSTKNTGWKAFFLFFIGGLIVLHFLSMLEMNIEMVHALEFTLLAFLLFPLTRSFSAAIIYCLPFILVNEWYQFKILYPHYIKYFEFNDIFLDLMGCGMAMISLWLMGISVKKSEKKFWRKPEFLSLAALNIFFGLALATCVFSLYDSTQCDHTLIVLNQLENPFEFWRTHPFTGAVYHVMKPVEGMVAISLLCLIYIGMDHIAQKEVRHAA